jgi:hypothetical protein
MNLSGGDPWEIFIFVNFIFSQLHSRILYLRFIYYSGVNAVYNKISIICVVADEKGERAEVT